MDGSSTIAATDRTLAVVSEPARRASRLAPIAESQHGLLTRSQLREYGFDADAVRNHVRAGRWQIWGRRVVALHTGPLSAQQTEWFAVLEGGDHCVLAGISALHRFGLTGFTVDRIQTAVPFGTKGERHELFVRRQCRRLSVATVHPSRLPPTMRLPVALVDALEHSHVPMRGCALLAAVVQQRLIRAESLRAVLMETPTLPNRRLYTSVAGDIEGGAHSLLEIDFRRLARQAGIPAPRGQSVRLDRQGRRRYLDADFGGFGVEVDGAIHLRPLSWWEDMFRLNDIVIADKPMLRFPSVGIRLSRPEVIDQLRRAASRWL